MRQGEIKKNMRQGEIKKNMRQGEIKNKEYEAKGDKKNDYKIIPSLQLK